jgi:hypothetical protein
MSGLARGMTREGTAAAGHAPARRHSAGLNGLLALQRSAGNVAVQRLLVDHRVRPRDGEELGSATAGPDADLLVTDHERGIPERGGGPACGEPIVQREEWAARVEDVKVGIPVIQAPSSPAGTPNRIPPRVDTAVTVTLDGWHAPMAPVEFGVDGSGGSNGAATINGAATSQQTAGATVQLRGTTQTAPGSAGNLRLAARIGGTTIGLSAPFTVAAIPQNFSTALDHPLTGTDRGIVVNNSWESDSGSTADLDQAQRSEKVQYYTATGLFAAGLNPRNSGYKQATTPPIQDQHGLPAAQITRTGVLSAQQVFVYKDNRTGVVDIPVRNSGFQISRTITAPTTSTLEITTAKVGNGGTAQGFTAAAGAGQASEKQAV